MTDGSPVPRPESKMERVQLVIELYRDSTGFVKRRDVSHGTLQPGLGSLDHLSLDDIS